MITQATWVSAFIVVSTTISDRFPLVGLWFMHIVMTASNGIWRHLIFRVTGPLSVTGEFPHKGHWRGVLAFSVICTWLNSWVNSREGGYLRRNRAHYDVILMIHSLTIPCYGIRITGLYQLWPWNSHKRPCSYISIGQHSFNKGFLRFFIFHISMKRICYRHGRYIYSCMAYTVTVFIDDFWDEPVTSLTSNFWISTGQPCASFLITTRGWSWHLYVLTVISVMPLIVQNKYQWYCKELVHLKCFFCKNTNKLRWNLLITIRLIRCLRRYIFFWCIYVWAALSTSCCTFLIWSLSHRRGARVSVGEV